MLDSQLLKLRPKQKMNVRRLAVQSVVAALYVTATLAVAPLSFGPVQLRFSEILVLLVFLDAGYAPALVIGCALANFFSPLGMIDVLFGTLGTLCTVVAISKTKNLFIATLYPTLFCIFVGVELYLVFQYPFWITTATVMIGEFAVVSCIGYPFFRILLKNEKLTALIRIKK